MPEMNGEGNMHVLYYTTKECRDLRMNYHNLNILGRTTNQPIPSSGLTCEVTIWPPPRAPPHLVLPVVSPHRLIHHASLQVVEDGVVVAGGLGTLQELAELLLQRLPANLHTLFGQCLVGPLLQLDVRRGVEGSCSTHIHT